MRSRQALRWTNQPLLEDVEAVGFRSAFMLHSSTGCIAQCVWRATFDTDRSNHSPTA
jgi:hypothetical protein